MQEQSMEEGLGKQLNAASVAQLPSLGEIASKRLPSLEYRAGDLWYAALKGGFKHLQHSHQS